MERQSLSGMKDLLTNRSGTNNAFRNTNHRIEFDPKRFEQQTRQAGIDPVGRFVVAVCIGVRPDFDREHPSDYREITATNLKIYQDIQNRFAENKWGFEVFCNESNICMACFFEQEKRGHFAEKYIQPFLDELESCYGLMFFAGIGRSVDGPAQFEESFESAYLAYHTYFFNPTQMIILNNEGRERRYAAIDEYLEGVEKAFRAILVHDPEAVEKLAAVVDILYDFHYGNRQALIMHTMEYTGTIAMRLKQYRLLEGNFFEMQNILQVKVSHAATYSELREIISQHFQKILPRIYVNDRPKAKLVIEQVKEYTKEHYMENMTVEKMAGFAHFSTDYFSHLFKSETGKTYKAFLTEIRMKHAIELLRDTEYRIDEISAKVGYNNPRAFGDAFKQIYSVSPMEYRRIHKKK